MTNKLPSLNNHIFFNCYPNLTPYQGYEILACPYLLARLTMGFGILVPISWRAMGIEAIPSSGLYSLINFKQGYKIKPPMTYQS